MLVTHKMKMDLERMREKRIINVSQWDIDTQQIRWQMFSGSSPWQIPENAKAVIYFQKPDGKRGKYDTLPNGEPAWSAFGNELFITLAPQVMTAAGSVILYARLFLDGRVLSTADVEICVCAHKRDADYEEMLESEDYFYVMGMLPVPEQAKIGQYIRVLEVDEAGKVIRVEAASGADDASIRQIVEEYLEENPPTGTGSGTDGTGIVNITIEEVN